MTQQPRIILVRHFSRFLLRAGYPAYVPESGLAARKPPTFVPRLLSDEDLGKLFHAVDVLEPTARSPWRHVVMPEIFRLLYGCGFRVGEVLKLCVRDVDLDRGIITVRQAKLRKDRLVPPAPSLVIDGLLAGRYSRSVATEPQPEDGPLVLWASQTGTAEAFAAQVAGRLRGARLRNMDEAPLAELSERRDVVIVTSTFGDGGPPDNGADFWDRLHATDTPALEGMRYAVLGIGDRVS